MVSEARPNPHCWDLAAVEALGLRMTGPAFYFLSSKLVQGNLVPASPAHSGIMPSRKESFVSLLCFFRLLNTFYKGE